MEGLLEFQSGFDPQKVRLLDEIVGAVSGDPQRSKDAQAILTQFQDHPDAWTTVDKILDNSLSPETKFFALQVLEKAIKYRWKILPENQREGIKGYLVNLVIRLSQCSPNEQTLPQQTGPHTCTVRRYSTLAATP
eukprot:c12235_g1_i1.p1 GENE.c12235_g1_i1~~c12235_g1_i1.p1  ORF type:complete len:135 (-),score=36.17 c12235_g1_i1:761-1165(-)